jgi:hypothetical protein
MIWRRLLQWFPDHITSQTYVTTILKQNIKILFWFNITNIRYSRFHIFTKLWPHLWSNFVAKFKSSLRSSKVHNEIHKAVCKLRIWLASLLQRPIWDFVYKLACEFQYERPNFQRTCELCNEVRNICGQSFVKSTINNNPTVVPIEAFRKMLTNSFPNLKEHLWTIPQKFDKFLKKFLTSCFIDQSDCSKIKYKIWLVNETGS